METRAQRALKSRISALQQLNSFRFPLPYELLTFIFDFACPSIDFGKRSLCESDDDGHLNSVASYDRSGSYPRPANKHDLSCRYMPLILGAVCSRWREVALSSPGLWSTFALKVISWKLKFQVPLLRLYLTNTGPLPFSLDLYIRQFVYFERHRTEAPATGWKNLRPLADVIFYEFPEKIQTLRIAGAPPGWMYFLSQQNFPNLKDLTFTCGEELGVYTTVSIKQGAFTIKPSELRRIGGAANMSRSTSGLPPLTILHLRNVGIKICIEILLSCPHLIEYHCYMPTLEYYRYLKPPVNSKNPLILPNLKHFGWVFDRDEGEVNAALFENIHLPNLESLLLGEFPWGEEASRIRFFSKLPKTLRSFTCYGYKSHLLESEDRYQFLSRIPSVRSLGFRQCSGIFTKKMFRHLSDSTAGVEPAFWLPDLDIVTITGIHKDCTKKSVGKALVTMMDKRRRSLGISDFTFEAEECKVRWTRDGQKKQERLSARTEGMKRTYFSPKDIALFFKQQL